MADHHLTRCELEVMQVVWDQGCVTVQDVVDVLGRALAYTTVLTTMKILDDKRIVRRAGKQGRAYLYQPLITREDVRRSMTSELKDALFGGSLKSMVLSLIDGSGLHRKDVDELRRAIKSLEADS